MYRIYNTADEQQCNILNTEIHSAENYDVTEIESDTEYEYDTGSDTDKNDNEVTNFIEKGHRRLENVSAGGLKHLTQLGMLQISKKQLKSPLNYVRCVQGKTHAKAYKNDQINTRSQLKEQERSYIRTPVGSFLCQV